MLTMVHLRQACRSRGPSPGCRLDQELPDRPHISTAHPNTMCKHRSLHLSTTSLGRKKSKRKPLDVCLGYNISYSFHFGEGGYTEISQRPLRGLASVNARNIFSPRKSGKSKSHTLTLEKSRVCITFQGHFLCHHVGSSLKQSWYLPYITSSPGVTRHGANFPFVCSRLSLTIFVPAQLHKLPSRNICL